MIDKERYVILWKHSLDLHMFYTARFYRASGAWLIARIAN